MIAISRNSTSNWQRAWKEHEAAVVRLSHVPGLGVDSAQQIVAEIGPTAAVFPSAAQLCSWVGTCPGREESAEESKSNRSPKGNRSLRRILDQAANAAVKTKDPLFQALYRRIRGRDQKKHNLAISAVANRLCRIVWKILHQGVPYEERASQSNRKAIKDRARRLIRELRRLGYSINATSSEAEGLA